MSTVSCLCGKVKLECPAEAAMSAFCHCSECRICTSAPFFWGVGYPIDAVKVDDNLCMPVLVVPEKKTTRHRCKECGTFMYEKLEKAPIILVPGSLMPNAPKPTMHIFVENKVVMLPQDGLLRFAGMPAEGVEPMPADTA
jgi:hypothetical protein